MNISVPHSTPKQGLSATRQASRESGGSQDFFQLSLPIASLQEQQKPQISSIPEIPPKQRDRYRVMLGDLVLGDRVTLDEALKLAKGGAR